MGGAEQVPDTARGPRKGVGGPVNSAAVTSPEPLAFSGRRGVATSQAPAGVTASISKVSGSASGRSTLVTSTLLGPIARAASTEASVLSRSVGSVPVR